MTKRQPLHPCARCGAAIKATKKYCSPCAAEILQEQLAVNSRASKQRKKEGRDANHAD